MTRAMEAVATDVVLLIEVVGESVHIGVLWHRLMEGCVEDSDLGRLR